MNQRRALASVLVAGSGPTGLLAAIALRRALPQAAITVVDAPADPAALADRLPAVFPSARAVLERRIGLDETRLVSAGLANHWLADSFADWGTSPAWLRGFGGPAGELGPGTFHQHWLDARRHGQAGPYDAYQPSAAIARAHGDAPPAMPAGLGDHGLRFDPVRFAAWLTRQLPSMRVAYPSSPLMDGRFGDTGLTAAVLADGAVLTADLFVDCTGPAARLLSRVEDRFEPWDEAIRCDRLLVAPGAAQEAPVNAYAALEIGWSGRVRLPGAAIDHLAWPTDLAGEGRARRLFGHGAVAESVALRPGRRRSAVVGNVVALGDAALQLGPLGTLGLTAALGALDLLIELLPGQPITAAELAEFNRRASLQADRLRDFAALPVLASARGHGAFWKAARAAALPSSLAELLAQFRRRGLVPRPDEDLLETHDWLSALLGLGIVPELPDPIAAGRDASTTADILADIERRLAAAMPPAIRPEPAGRPR